MLNHFSHNMTVIGKLFLEEMKRLEDAEQRLDRFMHAMVAAKGDDTQIPDEFRESNVSYEVQYLDKDGIWCYDVGSETTDKEFSLLWLKDASKNSDPSKFRAVKIEVIG